MCLTEDTMKGMVKPPSDLLRPRRRHVHTASEKAAPIAASRTGAIVRAGDELSFSGVARRKKIKEVVQFLGKLRFVLKHKVRRERHKVYIIPVGSRPRRSPAEADEIPVTLAALIEASRIDHRGCADGCVRRIAESHAYGCRLARRQTPVDGDVRGGVVCARSICERHACRQGWKKDLEGATDGVTALVYDRHCSVKGLCDSAVG